MGYRKQLDTKYDIKNSNFIYIYWRRQWHPTTVLLPGESLGRRSLAGYSLWGLKESDMTEQLTHSWCPVIET